MALSGLSDPETGQMLSILTVSCSPSGAFCGNLTVHSRKHRPSSQPAATCAYGCPPVGAWEVRTVVSAPEELAHLRESCWVWKGSRQCPTAEEAPDCKAFPHMPAGGSLVSAVRAL